MSFEILQENINRNEVLVQMTDTEIMLEFIKLRNVATKNLSASFRFASLEAKLVQRQYADVYYKLSDIFCTFRTLRTLKACEFQYLSNLLNGLEARLIVDKQH